MVHTSTMTSHKNSETAIYFQFRTTFNYGKPNKEIIYCRDVRCSQTFVPVTVAVSFHSVTDTVILDIELRDVNSKLMSKQTQKITHGKSFGSIHAPERCDDKTGSYALTHTEITHWNG